MPINVNVENEAIEVSTSGQTVSATVSGGQGPPGPTGATGATGPAGEQGEPGVVYAAAPITYDAETQTVGIDLPLAISDVSGLQTALDAKATPADVSTAISNVIDAAPAALDTLNELAAALGDDANFASTVTTALSGKAPLSHTHAAGDIVSGTIDADRLPFLPVYPIRVMHAGGVLAFNSWALTASPTYYWGGSSGDMRTLATISYPAKSVAVSVQQSVTKFVQDNPGATLNYASLEVVLIDAANRIVGWATTSTTNATGTTNGTAGVSMTVDLLAFPTVGGLWNIGGNTDTTGKPIHDLMPVSAYKFVASQYIDNDATAWANIVGKPTFAAVATSGSASDLTAGTLPNARIPSTTVSAGSYGSASSVATFTVGADGRLTAAGSSSIAISAAAVSGLAGVATAGTFASLTSKPTTLSGYGITDAAAAAHTHAASDIVSGTVATARLGSGTADSTTFLRGDQTYALPPVTSVDGAVGAVSVTKSAVYEFTRTSKPASATGSNGSYSWSLPAGAKIVEVLLIGGGGGGGSGRRGASGTARFGGGGGGAACATLATIDASLLSGTMNIAVGAGGAGGSAATADDTNGNNGSAGGMTSLQIGSVLIRGWSGNGGGGGSATAGSAGTFNSIDSTTFRPLAAGAGSATATAGSGFTAAGFAGVGGAAGGGISTANVVLSPGTQYTSGGGLLSLLFVNRSAQTAGTASTTAAAVDGPSGLTYGDGGCGGGASANGFSSGAGGNGASGYLRITVWS